MRTHSKLSLTLSALAAAVFCAQAQAQAQETQQLQRVEVTGSNIKRLAAETASPVQVYSRDDIRKTGANTVRQILDTLTATVGTEIRDDGNNSSFASGASGVSMRGLGKGATLVLLNGRRVANYGLADGAKDTFVNVDSIPSDVVERVEIVKDGASAVYGSDAMAGVINIITRREYNGVGMSASYTFNERPNAGAQTQAGLVAGYGSLEKDGFNVFANLEAYRREGYTLDKVKDDYAPWHKAAYNQAFGDPSTLSSPGTLRFAGKRVPVAGCTTVQASGQCVMDINGLNQVSDPAKRLNLYTAGRAKLGNDLQAFAEVSYSKTTTEYRNLPPSITAGAVSRWYDGYQNKLQSVDHPTLAANNPAVTASYKDPITGRVGIDYRFMDNPDLFKYDNDANQYRVLAGLQGVFRDMDWEVAVGRTGASADKLSRWAHRDLYTAVADGTYKIGQVNDPAKLDAWFPMQGMKGKNHQNFIDAKLSGELMALPGGPLAFAVGAEHRAENVSIRSTDNVLKAEIIGRGSVLIEGKRNMDAAFFELNAPVLKGLELNGALRYDKASGFAGRVSPKLGARWELSPQFMLRGTVAGGFRAPNIPETLGTVGITGFYNNTVDPARCDTARKVQAILNNGNATDKADATRAYNSGCNTSVPAMISANPNLKPETSKSITLGFVLEPSRNLTVAMDYFVIERRDEIATRDLSYVLSKEGQPGYEKMISRGAVTRDEQDWIDRANAMSPGANLSWSRGSLASLLLAYENFGKTRTSGIDFDVRGSVGNANFGTLNIGLAATYMLAYKPWDVDLNKWRPNQVGNYQNPRLKAVLSTAWSKGPWATGLRFNYTSKTQLNRDEADLDTQGEAACMTSLALKKVGGLPCFIDSDLRTDFNLAYTGFKNLRLSLNIINLTGEEHPVNLREGYKLRPRSYKIGAEYRF
ncbi:TonB-dependent receptor [Pelomonas sp. CA6]|uniref:TonB-dependent receptor domain-containing protein n=1 Tax=Pelomonas sp. CA6 TaxID=2907999 RepID=UPI001F4C08E8|nr:TonB-dependent receptor [Pelomonas sp. CA6]MCH7344646.1 TonB-dependent receptor [Pelomonas sp. CA6]